MTVRRFFVKVHLYTGLATAAFLLVIGLTGTILSFEPDYDRWVNPALWRVPRRPRLPEQTLVDTVQRELRDAEGPARVATIALSGGNVAQVFTLTNGERVFVDPSTGRVLGERRGPTRLESFLLDVRVLHTGLVGGERGRLVVDVVTATFVLVIVPLGIYLWWKRKRATVGWRESWKRVTWDLHNILGLYAGLFLLILAVTGIFLGYERPLYWLVRAAPVAEEPPPRSTVPDTTHARPGGFRPPLDSLLVTADRALSGAATYEVRLPSRPRSVVQVLKHGPGAGHSTVYLDQYSGRVLRVDDFSRAPRAYRAHVTDQAIHMGAAFGFPTRLVAALSGLALTSLVLTGVIVWWRKVV